MSNTEAEHTYPIVFVANREKPESPMILAGKFTLSAEGRQNDQNLHWV
jgi:hypothetical protein